MTILYIILAIFVAPVIIEFSGYWWHRMGEHGGKLGKAVVAKHHKHHEHDYPVAHFNLGEKKYRGAGSWSWYVLGALIITLLYLVLPQPFSFISIVSGLLYAKFVMSFMHGRFHIDSRLEDSGWFIRRKQLHEIHHYGPYNYGISFFAVDKLFGTYRDTYPPSKESNFPT